MKHLNSDDFWSTIRTNVLVYPFRKVLFFQRDHELIAKKTSQNDSRI